MLLLADCRSSDVLVRYQGWQSLGVEQRGVGAVSGWLGEKDILESFTFLRFDCLIALWHPYLYDPQPSVNFTGLPSQPNASTPRSDVLSQVKRMYLASA